jgi:hypothetical protein
VIAHRAFPAALLGLLLCVGCSKAVRPQPERIDFGPVWIGQTASVPRPVLWRNDGRNAKNFTGATFSGDPAFAFAGPPPIGQVAPDASGAPAVVTFSPQTTGEMRATVTPTGLRSEPLLVMGTGVAQRRRGMLELTADGMKPGKPLEMGTVQLNRIGLTGVYLANRAREPMRLNIRFATGRAVRVVGPQFPLVLEPGRRVRVTLEFCPGALGRLYDAVEVESTDGVHFAGTALAGNAIR